MPRGPRVSTCQARTRGNKLETRRKCQTQHGKYSPRPRPAIAAEIMHTNKERMRSYVTAQLMELETELAGNTVRTKEVAFTCSTLVTFRVNHEVNLAVRCARKGDYQPRLTTIKIRAGGGIHPFGAVEAGLASFILQRYSIAACARCMVTSDHCLVVVGRCRHAKSNAIRHVLFSC
jgi:hypothetical protein